MPILQKTKVKKLAPNHHTTGRWQRILSLIEICLPTYLPTEANRWRKVFLSGGARESADNSVTLMVISRLTIQCSQKKHFCFILSPSHPAV